MQQAQHTLEQAVITGSGLVTKGSGATAVVSGASQYVADNPDLLTLADFGIIAGIVGVICGVSINGVAQFRRDRRERAIYEEKMRHLKTGAPLPGPLNQPCTEKAEQ